jgi:hypothetical protein
MTTTAVTEAPLSVMQRMLARPAATMGITVAIDDGPDLDEIAAAAHVLAERHAALRTTVDVRTGVQVVHPPEDGVLDVVVLDGPGSAGERIRVAGEEPITPHELPVFRCLMATDAPGTTLVQLVAAHVVCDSMSAFLLARELLAVLAGDELDEAPLGFAEVRAARAALLADPATWAEGGAGARAAAHWDDVLAGAEPVPFGAATPVPGHRRMDLVAEDLNPDTSRRLADLTKQSGVSLFHAALVAFAEAVSRVCGVDDVVTVAIVHGRVRAEHRPVVGCFIEETLFRHRLDAPRRDLMKGTARAAMHAYLHQEPPPVELAGRVAALEPFFRGSSRRSLAFQYRPDDLGRLLARWSGPWPARPAPGLDAPHASYLPGMALFSVDDRPDGLGAEIWFDRNRWDADEMRHLVQAFVVSARALADSPDEVPDR